MLFHPAAVPKGTAVFLPNNLTREAKIDYYINENDYQYHRRGGGKMFLFRKGIGFLIVLLGLIIAMREVVSFLI